MQYFFRGAVAFLALTILAPSAFAADAAKGEIIAKRWCAACHLVASNQTKENSDVPSFASIAHRKPSAKELAVFLTDPHHKMSDMSLPRNEIADIVAYINPSVSKFHNHAAYLSEGF